MKDSRQLVESYLAEIDVAINGGRPFDIQVNNEDLYDRIISGGRLAVGESYMDGWWDCDDLEKLFCRALGEGVSEKFGFSWKNWFYLLQAKFFNLQSKKRANEVGEKHYDAGNGLYEAMLDDYMIYSCAYWKEADNLDEAQRDKLDLICRKLKLESGQRLLDIGCGWSGLAKYAAENYGVEVVGLTISQEQVKYGREFCSGLPVEIRFQDYRALDEKFDRIVSVGMFEHVGVKNYREFMEIVSRSLRKDGLFLLHTIGSNLSNFATDPWIHKYIFPNGMLPSPPQISEAAEALFIVEDWHNFGPDYARTLRAWRKKFEEAWPELKNKYSESFYRMWIYYLNVCAAAFCARQNQLWQIVFSPLNTSLQNYRSIR